MAGFEEVVGAEHGEDDGADGRVFDFWGRVEDFDEGKNLQGHQ